MGMIPKYSTTPGPRHVFQSFLYFFSHCKFYNLFTQWSRKGGTLYIFSSQWTGHKMLKVSPLKDLKAFFQCHVQVPTALRQGCAPPNRSIPTTEVLRLSELQYLLRQSSPALNRLLNNNNKSQWGRLGG